MPANDVPGTDYESYQLWDLQPPEESDLMTLDKEMKLCITQGEVSLGWMRAHSRKWFYFLFVYLTSTYILPIMYQAVFKAVYKW